MPISPITDIIAELKRGRMVILMDDEDRENEGDLVIAAEHVRAADINFMATHGRGLICLTLTPDRCEQLRLPLQASDAHRRLSTAFTVSIEAAHGVTTGISAADRATTIKAAIKPDAKPADIVTPGHIFPLMARKGGVLARAGHTEAGCDLARLAGLASAAAICEIMNEDGTMSRLPELETFAVRHDLKIGTIADLIHYRLENESTVRRTGECLLPTEFGEFRCVAYHDDIGDGTHLALVKGGLERNRPALVRVHVQESLLDLVTQVHRAGAWTLRAALARVASDGEGVVVILEQKESSAELQRHIERLRAGGQPKAGAGPAPERTVMRTYGLGSQILADLGAGKLRVLGHAARTPGLSGFGLEVVEYIEPEPRLARVETLTEIKEKKSFR